MFLLRPPLAELVSMSQCVQPMPFFSLEWPAFHLVSHARFPRISSSMTVEQSERVCRFVQVPCWTDVQYNPIRRLKLGSTTGL